MALTTVPSTLTPEIFSAQFFSEYVQANKFSKYMGTDENAIIQLREELLTEAGQTVVFELINELEGDGVTTDSVIGNEETLVQRSFRVQVNPVRHGVVSQYHERKKSPIDLMKAKKAALKTWILKKTRTDLINALSSINGVAYTSATEGQKDAWLVDNADRVLFGSVVANHSSLDHSTSLANIDSVADVMSPEILSLAKRRAVNASPAIRPTMTKDNGEEWYVAFLGSNAFRDFKSSGTITQAQREAWTRGEGNPLFTGGNLIWDGVIVVEIPQIQVISGVGAAGIDVEPCYLVGAQALGIAWALRTEITVDETDHKWKKSVAIAEIRGIAKLLFGSGATDTDDLKQHGVHTIYVASIPDA